MKTQTRAAVLGSIVWVFLLGDKAQDPVPGIISAVSEDESLADITIFNEDKSFVKDMKHCSKLSGAEEMGWSYPAEYSEAEIFLSRSPIKKEETEDENPIVGEVWEKEAVGDPKNNKLEGEVVDPNVNKLEESVVVVPNPTDSFFQGSTTL